MARGIPAQPGYLRSLHEMSVWSAMRIGNCSAGVWTEQGLRPTVGMRVDADGLATHSPPPRFSPADQPTAISAQTHCGEGRFPPFTDVHRRPRMRRFWRI